MSNNSIKKSLVICDMQYHAAKNYHRLQDVILWMFYPSYSHFLYPIAPLSMLILLLKFFNLNQIDLLIMGLLLFYLFIQNSLDAISIGDSKYIKIILFY